MAHYSILTNLKTLPRRLLLLFLAFAVVNPTLQVEVPEHEILSRIDDLMTKRQESWLIDLNSFEDFNKYLVKNKRNYTSVVYFTIGDERKCPYCPHVQEMLEYLSSKYLEQIRRFEDPEKDDPKPMFFFRMTRENHQQMFKKIRAKPLPTIMFFPPNGMLSNVQRIKNKHLGDLGLIRDFIADCTNQDVHIDLKDAYENSEEPPPPSKLGASLGLLVILGLGYFFRARILGIIKSVFTSGFFAYGIMTVIIVLIGGNIYNHIEKPHYGSTDKFDDMVYGGYEYQFQVEAHVVTIIYLVICLAFIQLIEGRRLTLTRSKGGRIRTALGFIAAAGFLYALHNIYRRKAGEGWI